MKRYKGAREGYDPRNLPGINRIFVSIAHKLSVEERRERRLRNRAKNRGHRKFYKRGHGRQ